MIRTIDGWVPDGEGHWVAVLSCLHGQHVRHQPPWQERPWVESEEDRTGRIGTDIECPRCDRAELPDDLDVVRTAGPFDEATLPSALQRDHRVAPRTWGRLRVLDGDVVFHLEGDAPFRRAMTKGESQPIPPDVPHRLELVGPVRVAVDFLVRR